MRVRVATRTVNVSDLELRRGDYPQLISNLEYPAILGWDFAGTLLDPTDNLLAGTPVAGYVQWIGPDAGRGTYADVISVPASYVAELAHDTDPHCAALFALNGLTAAQATDLMGPLEGANVMVVGASGPVGLAAAIIAAERGANVFVSGSRNDEYLASLGFAGVVERANAAKMAAQVRDWIPDGVDALFNPAIASPGIIAAVRDGGRFISAHVFDKAVAERGISIAELVVHEDAPRLTQLLGSSLPSHARIADVLKLEDARHAHERVETESLGGQKIMLDA
ncbi:alcohol dehydrogenase catalytic domain-containing protein [Mycolicibacterium septicum]|uniref:alcohol dehydrogenase catalytic domain-containing protein n=1 Tax=Mycolicibacterium septicum TaxID=98668 RepID=UPI003908A026